MTKEKFKENEESDVKNKNAEMEIKQMNKYKIKAEE